MDEITQVQIMRERNTSEGDLEWARVMEECKRELLCVRHKMPHYSGGPHLFASSDEDSEEDAPCGIVFSRLRHGNVDRD